MLGAERSSTAVLNRKGFGFEGRLLRAPPSYPLSMLRHDAGLHLAQVLGSFSGHTLGGVFAPILLELNNLAAGAALSHSADNPMSLVSLPSLLR